MTWSEAGWRVAWLAAGYALCRLKLWVRDVNDGPRWDRDE